ncbi:Glycerophosphoryl diester phosphodiesterase [hydrothermal vent metagenome]|uniref:Glycerophosphoryl diester phosphodiesterase n=1 Tax=hydrothermal vent metagenome TaxID=652676 RepID=A0A3B0X571_9ZZZZ
MTIKDKQKMAIPRLVAHRGVMANYPENTLISLESALLCGGEYIEFDVQCTADGQLVVIHDTELFRTTGIQGRLFEMSYSELKNIRAHEPERFSLVFFNQHIPLLSDIVQLLQSYPQATAFVEIKEETLQQYGTEHIMPELLKILDIVQSQCVIISFDESAIKYTRNKSDFLSGWVLHQYNEASHQQAKALAPDYLIINHRKIPENTAPWPGNWQWMVYDITDPELALHYAGHNISLIETCDICTMLEHPILALNKAPPLKQR